MTALVAALYSVVFSSAGTAQADSQVVQVFSPAMNKNIPVKVLRAAGGGPAPTLYLLDGLRAPDDNNGWLINTDVERFFADKHVNVAIPFGGGGTFYTDWERPDPKLGFPKWGTFLSKELPAYMAANFQSDGVNNSVAGLSMSGTSALNLAIQNPNFYKSVASFSGYPTVSSPGFAQGIAVSVAQMGGDANNMWGTWPLGEWTKNDPLLNVGALRGKRVYVSAGMGAPGKQDAAVTPGSPSFDPVRFVQLVPLETAAGMGSQTFAAALAAAGIPAQVDITPTGIHWWNHWQDKLHEAWYGTIAPSFGQ